jgi:hypothetical protein
MGPPVGRLVGRVVAHPLIHPGVGGSDRWDGCGCAPQGGRARARPGPATPPSRGPVRFAFFQPALLVVPISPQLVHIAHDDEPIEGSGAAG